MKELVVISGKGGTGKTSVVASFAALAQNAVLADCDVDAADLHLVLQPKVGRREVFKSGHEAVIRTDLCLGCGLCLAYCRFDAIRWTSSNGNPPVYHIDPLACEGCGVCVWSCPAKAIDFVERTTGEWYISETRFGPMVHAKLGIAAENSGKLVSLVRREAGAIAKEQGRALILVDGPPGIGCPVIASVTGATQVLVVTEPTCSGAHDFERVIALTRHFKIPTAVCVNKWDINPEMTAIIEAQARSLDVMVAGRIRYDRSVTAAQVQGRSVVECQREGCAHDIRRIWDCLKTAFEDKEHSK